MLIWRSCLRGRDWAAMLVAFAFLSLSWSSSSAADSVGGKLAEAKRAEFRRHASQPEAIAVVASLVASQEEIAPETFSRVLGDIVEGKLGASVDPLVRAQASYLLSLEEDRSGHLPQADARRKELGFLADGWVLGPFDGQGRSGHGRTYPVEQEAGAVDPRAGKTYAGKERAIAWRRAAPEAFVQGALFLDALLRPDSDAVAYCLTYLHSDREQWVALRVGSGGPVKAWLDGKAILSRDVVRPAWPDQDAAPMLLRKGANLLLVKTVAVRPPWRLFVRVTDARGAAPDGVKLAEEPAGPTAPAARTSQRAPSVRELGASLRAHAEKATKKEAPRAWLDYALYLSLATPLDTELRAVEMAARKAAAPSDPPVGALLLLGEVAREEDDRRAALESAMPKLDSVEKRALALSSIGQLWRAQHREDAAVAAWQKAVLLHPGCVPAEVALAREEQRAGLHLSALARLLGLPSDARGLPVVLDALADVQASLGRKTETEATRRVLFGMRRTDMGVLRELGSAARVRGDWTEAARMAAEGLRWRPDLSHLATDQAELLAGGGDVAGARAVLLAATRRLVGEARLFEELGRLEARAGQTEAALTNLRRALELRPQNPGLRRYVESLEATQKAKQESRSADALVSESAADGEALAREALFGARPEDDASAVVLLDRTAVRVHDNGLAERFVQRLVHARTERAARDSRETRVRFEPGRQEVEIRKARVLRRSASGELELSEATGRDEENTSEPWYGLYYDTRAAVVTFENLRAGDVVEVQYTVVDVGHRNEFADYFGDFESIADMWPTRRWDYTLLAPATRAFYFNQPRIDGMVPEKEVRGSDVRYRWEAKNVQRVESEPAMPGFSEVAPYLHVSTYRTWEDVGRWYWSLVADQMKDDGTLKRAAQEAARKAGSLRDRVKAIHRLVVEKTRYVGLEFGIHGYKPYKATQVLERGFGDCKDKATLLVTLLRSVGIDAELVLLRTRRGGRIDETPASLAVFDHAIAFVPGLDRYIDGTAEFSGVEELPAEDQDTMALRVSAAGAKLVRTPSTHAEDNRAWREWQVSWRPDGVARVAERLVITGQAAHEWRTHYQTEGERHERYAKVWNGRYAGAQLESVKMEVSDRNQPVRVSSTVLAPQFGERRGASELALPTSSREADLASTYARLGERHWPVVLGYPWQHVERVHYQLPERARIVRLPAERRVKNKFGELSLQVIREGSSVTLVSQFIVRVNRIEPADYAAFRAFLRDTDVALAERMVVELGRSP